MKLQTSNFKPQILIWFTLFLISFSSFSQNNLGPDVEDNPDRPQGCYFRASEPGRPDLVDKCIPCALPDIMQIVQPPSLCSDILALRNQYGCCPICWIVIDPTNFKLMINYLRDIHWGRGWRPFENDPTGLTQLINSIDTTNNTPTWGIYFPKTNQFLISSSKPQTTKMFGNTNGEYMGIFLSATPVSGRIQIGERALTEEIHNWLEMDPNPCSVGYSIPY
jgi:hypothetical protein